MKALSSPSEQLLFNGTGLMWAPTHNLQQPYLKVHPLGNRCTIASIDGTGFMQNIMKTQTTTNKATTEEKQLSSELALIKVSSDLPQLPEVASL